MWPDNNDPYRCKICNRLKINCCCKPRRGYIEGMPEFDQLAPRYEKYVTDNTDAMTDSYYFPDRRDPPRSRSLGREHENSQYAPSRNTFSKLQEQVSRWNNVLLPSMSKLKPKPVPSLFGRGSDYSQRPRKLPPDSTFASVESQPTRLPPIHPNAVGRQVCQQPESMWNTGHQSGTTFPSEKLTKSKKDATKPLFNTNDSTNHGQSLGADNYTNYNRYNNRLKAGNCDKHGKCFETKKDEMRESPELCPPIFGMEESRRERYPYTKRTEKRGQVDNKASQEHRRSRTVDPGRPDMNYQPPQAQASPFELIGNQWRVQNPTESIRRMEDATRNDLVRHPDHQRPVNITVTEVLRYQDNMDPVQPTRGNLSGVDYSYGNPNQSRYPVSLSSRALDAQNPQDSMERDMAEMRTWMGRNDRFDMTYQPPQARASHQRSYENPTQPTLNEPQKIFGKQDFTNRNKTLEPLNLPKTDVDKNPTEKQPKRYGQLPPIKDLDKKLNLQAPSQSQIQPTSNTLDRDPLHRTDTESSLGTESRPSTLSAESRPSTVSAEPEPDSTPVHPTIAQYFGGSAFMGGLFYTSLPPELQALPIQRGPVVRPQQKAIAGTQNKPNVPK